MELNSVLKNFETLVKQTGGSSGQLWIGNKPDQMSVVQSGMETAAPTCLHLMLTIYLLVDMPPCF